VIVGGFKRTLDEKREEIGMKVALQGQLKFCSNGELTREKLFLPSGTIATTSRWTMMMMTRPGEIATKRILGNQAPKRERQRKRERGALRRLGPTMMDEESFREEEW